MDSGPSTHTNGESQTASTSSAGQAIETVGESRIDPCRDTGVGSSSAIMSLGNDSDESMPSLGTISDDESPVSATHPRDSLRGGSRPASRNSPFRSATAIPSVLDRDGYSSDGSLPSMQTVSESSDDGLEGSTWGSDDDEEDESDDQEGDGPRRRSPTLPVPQRERPRRRFPDEPEEDDDWIDEPENPFAGFLDLVSNNTALGTALDNAAEALGLSRAELPPLPVTDSQRHLSPAALLQAIAQQMRMAFDPHNQPPEQHVDTHRAEVILKALEEVPTTLVSRYEQIRKGSDEDNDEGCAICRDTYILDADDPSLQPSETELLLDELPFRLSKMRPERILAFPCQGMHLFHAGCLGPWLSRKTTCPTCRFDIDPDSLTLRGQRDPISGRSLSKLWAPPPGREFVKWLQKEEIRRGHTHHDHSDPCT
ncbi:hypothetical protein BC629DRAFT_311051 [Irpex lacteus]|nr:hypothetical protein BC629DRAFT_311051 [Irpex lacteus]